jgi:hypothetical protein
MLWQADLLRAERLAGNQGPYCFGDQFLFQIVGGRLYVQFQTSNRPQAGVHTRESAGWFPGNMGPGERRVQGSARADLTQSAWSHMLRGAQLRLPDLEHLHHRCGAALCLPAELRAKLSLLGAGLAAAKGHVPYALFMLLDVLRTFPGQVQRAYTRLGPRKHLCSQLYRAPLAL